MDDLMLRVQATLGARYDLEREIGGGGMSRVFLARERQPARRVVVKVLPPEVADDVAVRRFRREIAVTASLQHPYVVPVLAAGEAGGLHWYVTPFLDGETLRHRLACAGRLPVAEVLRVLHDLAGALAYVHRHGVVHRDVKPENVLLHDGHAVLADFGSAHRRAADAAGTDDTLHLAVGTPGYMAPEQAAGDPALDARADLYALGVVAYELLVGAPPFARPTPRLVLVAHLRESAVPVERLRPDTPPILARLVARSLAKDPADRPRSALEVQAVLRAALADGEGTPVPAGVAPAGAPWRRWAATGAVAAATVASLAALDPDALRPREREPLAATVLLSPIEPVPPAVALLTPAPPPPPARVRPMAAPPRAPGTCEESETRRPRLPQKARAT